MTRRFLLLAFVAILIIVGASTPVWAAQLEVTINPDAKSLPFYIRYQKTIFIEYPEDGLIHDQLSGRDWHVTGSADSSNPGVQDLMDQMNRNILDSGSQASISDLDVSYDIHLRPFGDHTSIDYAVALGGEISNYIIGGDFQITLIDLGWRGLSAYDEVVIDGVEINTPISIPPGHVVLDPIGYIGSVEINTPISILESHSPETYELLAGTAADEVLLQEIINADFILEQPMTSWHFLLDPTGINAALETFGLRDEIAGHVVSVWTLGKGSLREGIQIEREFEAVVTLDREYTIRSIQPADNAVVRVAGFGTLDVLDGVEIVGVIHTPPEGYTTTSTGNFPIFIIYGMVGLATAAGIAFFLIRHRSRKNQSAKPQ